MRDMRKIIDLLTEMDWHDKSAIIPILKKYPGKFIHFSNLPKLGINPRKFHNDPHGIYFYPIDWLLHSDSERLKRGDQFNVKMPYYFIVSIDFGLSGIILSKFSWSDFDAISTRNGWKKLWDSVTVDGEGKTCLPHLETTIRFPSYYKKDDPGSSLWVFCDILQKNKILSWGKSLKGISYIYDDNNAIIHDYEPHQLLVLDPRIIKIIDSNVQTKSPETNKDYRKRDSDQNWAEWGVAITGIMKDVVEKYNGYLRWKDKRPIALFELDAKKFRLSYNDNWNSGLHLDFIYGRATDYYTIKTEKLREWSTEKVLTYLDGLVQKIVSLKSDLLFEPIVNPEVLREKAEQEFFKPDAQVEWTTTISNELNSVDKTYATIRMIGLENLTVDGIKTYSTLYIDVRPEYFKISVKLTVNEQTLALSNSDKEYTSLDDDFYQNTMQSFWQKIDSSEQLWVHQKENETYWRPRFDNHEEWKKFIGWIMTKLSLKCDFSHPDAIDYTSLNDREKRNLVADIQHAIRKF